ncbi:MAG TPA: hypothetical protein VK157_13760 [Phycisphaerales bacterium]|nr:hypothetical protein [Phycisphaerales bacterium]
MRSEETFCGCEPTRVQRACDGQTCPCCTPKQREFAYAKLRSMRGWIVAYAVVMLFFTGWAMPGALAGEAFEHIAMFACGWCATVLITLAFVGSVTREDHRPGQRVGLSWLGAWAGISCVAMAGLLGVLVQMYVL